MNCISKILTYCLVIVGLFVNSCSDVKYLDAYVYKKSASRENLPAEKFLNFVIKAKTTFSIQQEITLKESSEIIFTVLSLYDANNNLINFRKEIPSGTYKLTANNKQNNFELKDDMVFVLIVNGKPIHLKSSMKPTLLTK